MKRTDWSFQNQDMGVLWNALRRSKVQNYSDKYVKGMYCIAVMTVISYCIFENFWVNLKSPCHKENVFVIMYGDDY